MKWSSYLKDRSYSVLFFTLLSLCVFGFLLFLDIPPAIAVMTILIFLIAYLFTLFLDYLRRKDFYEQIKETMEDMEDKTFLTEVVKEPGFYEGRLMYQLIAEEEKYFNNKISDQELELLEYKEYVEMWAHEVKTPIAVYRLMRDNSREGLIQDLEEQMNAIEGYVEQMLFYAKAGSLERDYSIRPIELKKLVANALRKCAKLMVEEKVRPELSNLQFTVMVDTKWMEFVLGQVMTNAVKYRAKDRKAVIRFSACEKNKKVVLTIEDNGVGIPEKDVNKVFQKGFTGENGRKYGRSTGMGLYICKSLCDKMGIELFLTSKEGENTVIKMVIPMEAECLI